MKEEGNVSGFTDSLFMTRSIVYDRITFGQNEAD